MGLQYRVIVFRDAIGFKGQCFQIVYTLAIQYSLHRYIGPKVYTIWVHGPLGKEPKPKRNALNPDRIPKEPKRNPSSPNRTFEGAASAHLESL